MIWWGRNPYSLSWDDSNSIHSSHDTRRWSSVFVHEVRTSVIPLQKVFDIDTTCFNVLFETLANLVQQDLFLLFSILNGLRSFLTEGIPGLCWFAPEPADPWHSVWRVRAAGKVLGQLKHGDGQKGPHWFSAKWLKCPLSSRCFAQPSSPWALTQRRRRLLNGKNQSCGCDTSHSRQEAYRRPENTKKQGVKRQQLYLLDSSMLKIWHWNLNGRSWPPMLRFFAFRSHHWWICMPQKPLKLRQQSTPSKSKSQSAF